MILIKFQQDFFGIKKYSRVTMKEYMCKKSISRNIYNIYPISSKKVL